MTFLKIHLVLSTGCFVTISISAEDNLLEQAVGVQRAPLKVSWSIQLISFYLNTPITQKLLLRAKHHFHSLPDS